jgi:hypothetical protein
MRRLCLSSRFRFIILPLTAAFVLACGGSNNGSLDKASPPPSPQEALGREIADTYGLLLLQVERIVEPRPPAAEARESLRELRDEFKVYFGNYGCLRESMSPAEQKVVDSTASQNRDASPDDLTWLQDASDDYDLEDPAISDLLADIRTLDDYAYLDQLASRRPGEVVLCNS